MNWKPVDAPDILRDVIMFDGDCVLCSRHAKTIDRLDQARRFAFVAVQDETGRWLCQRFGVSIENPETYVVVMEGRAYFKADAVLALARALPGQARLRIAGVIPRILRNAGYDLIARYRYRWFGRKSACALASPGLQARLAPDPQSLLVARSGAGQPAAHLSNDSIGERLTTP